jgi:PII-like signaling protein
VSAEDEDRAAAGRADRYQPVPLRGPARRLTIFLDETDQFQHKPLYSEIVHRAHRSGLAGATVLRGFEGYGASRHLHTVRLLSLSEDLPIMIVIVDDRERIDRFLVEVDEILSEGLVLVEDVQVVHYFGRRPPAGAAR